MTKLFALPLGLLALGLSAQASAVLIAFQYDGTITGIGTETTTATAFFANPPGVIGTALNYTYAQTPVFAGGIGSVSTAAGSINFTMTGTYAAGVGVSGVLLSFSGGTGSYTGYTGTGSLSHTNYPPVNGVVSDQVGGQFSANINPVPKPASLLALGVGAATVLRRRARKAN